MPMPDNMQTITPVSAVYVAIENERDDDGNQAHYYCFRCFSDFFGKDQEFIFFVKGANETIKWETKTIEEAQSEFTLFDRVISQAIYYTCLKSFQEKAESMTGDRLIINKLFMEEVKKIYEKALK